ncbi:alpha/beta hydrolase [Pseudomonas wadenswilerensis]
MVILLGALALAGCKSFSKETASDKPLVGVGGSGVLVGLGAGTQTQVLGAVGSPPVALFDNVVIRTYFATNRNQTGPSKSPAFFGNQEAGLSYGVADVSIPRDHRLTEMEAPFLGKWFETPKRHLMLLDVSTASRDQVIAAIREKVSSTKGKSALVFIHGYNVSFEDTARRTAQLSYDLGFEGAPIFYSWPSQHELLSYGDDEKLIERAKPSMKSFLADVWRQTDAQNIYFVAHSMGNRGLTSALAELVKENDTQTNARMRRLILTAPDIDHAAFDKIREALVSTGAPVTLYAASNDNALWFSKRLHEESDRVGSTSRKIMISQGIETIDASDVKNDLIGHSYYAENSSVVADMFYLFQTDLRAQQRFNLKPISTSDGTYWKFKPMICRP